MSFLSALSDEEQKIKNAKQERLRAELAEQVQAKREEKLIAEEARLMREQKEYEEEMAARQSEKQMAIHPPAQEEMATSFICLSNLILNLI